MKRMLSAGHAHTFCFAVGVAGVTGTMVVDYSGIAFAIRTKRSLLTHYPFCRQTQIDPLALISPEVC